MANAVGALTGALVLSTIFLLAGPLAVSPASAAGCAVLDVTPLGGQAPSAILVTAPSALTGQELQVGNVSLSQRGEAVELRSMRRLAASRVDVAMVLETGGSAPDSTADRARRLALAFLADLPRGVRVAVVSAGNDPKVLSALSADRAQALVAVRRAGRSAEPAAVNAVALAADVLKTTEARSRHVVLISRGRGDSRGDIVQVVKALDQSGTSIHAVGLGRPVQRAWGEQCPSVVGAGQAAAAGSLLALRVTGTYEVFPVRADPSLPLTVRVHSGVVDVSAQTRALGAVTAVRGTRIEGPQPTGAGQGVDGWLLAGLAVVVALVLGLVLLSPLATRGRAQPSQTNLFTERHVILLPPGPPAEQPDPPEASPKQPPVV
jgi:hypothetical protein